MDHHHLIRILLCLVFHHHHHLRSTQHLLLELDRHLLIQYLQLRLINNSSNRRHNHKDSNSNNLRIHQQLMITPLHTELPQLVLHGLE